MLAHNMKRRLFGLTAILLSLASICIASTGDNLPEFINCVDTCVLDNCRPPHQATLPLHLRLLFWTCPSECDYTCQRSITASRIAADLPIEQFHGKWPFRRLLGVQEPFSVLFSILNGYQHVLGLRLIRTTIPKSYPMRKYYVMFAYIGMVCWTFSSIFHTRDSITTERLDYFGAGGNVLYGLFYAPIRIFRWYNNSSDTPVVQIWGFICAACYTCHVFYLQFIKWDYSYNMLANIVVGVLQNLVWVYYSVVEYKRTRETWRLWPLGVVLSISAAMSLEILDFPPWFDAIDAHSLWHAATILPTAWWYRFLVRDANVDMMEGRLKA